MEYLEFNSKNVFWATKCLCKSVDKNGFTAIKLKANQLFVKVGKNDYREVVDLYNANCKWYPKFLILKEQMTHYRTKPKKDGEYFITEIEPLIKDGEHRKMDIVELAFIAANKRKAETLENTK